MTENSSAPLLSFEGVTRRFGRVTALDAVSFRVDEGEAFALLGANGAGKTTTMRIIATLLPPDSGRVSVLGHDVVADGANVRAVVGFSMQDVSLAPYATAREHLLLMARLHGLDQKTALARARELIDSFDLGANADRPVRTLSGGTRRRIDLVCALLHRPRLLLLDEPTTGLDFAARSALWDQITTMRREGVSIVLSTHQLDEADGLCERIAILHEGKLLDAGSTSHLKARLAPVSIVATFDSAKLEAARCVMADLGAVTTVNDTTLQLEADDALHALERTAARLHEAHVIPQRLVLGPPTLEAVVAAYLRRQPQ